MAEIKLSPLAYIDIFRHCKIAASESHLIYGLLTGYVEDNIPFVKSYIPLSHTSGKGVDFEMRHEIFQKIEEFNNAHFDPDYISDQIVGWVRSFPSESFNVSNIDKKNQIYLQVSYNANAFALFIPANGDQYGMAVKKFTAPLPEIDDSAPLEEIDWNFGEIEDLDDLFNLVINLQIGKNEKKPLISEELTAEEVQKVE